MKRLGRWAFNILSGVSLAFCVLSAVLWVGGTLRTEDLAYRRRGFFIQAVNPYRRVLVCWSTDPAVGPQGWRYRRHRSFSVSDELGTPDWQAGPVEWWRWPALRIVAVRCWTLLLVFCLAPAAWLMRARLTRRRYRAQLGLCPLCATTSAPLPTAAPNAAPW